MDEYTEWLVDESGGSKSANPGECMKTTIYASEKQPRRNAALNERKTVAIKFSVRKNNACAILGDITTIEWLENNAKTVGLTGIRTLNPCVASEVCLWAQGLAGEERGPAGEGRGLAGEREGKRRGTRARLLASVGRVQSSSDGWIPGWDLSLFLR